MRKPVNKSVGEELCVNINTMCSLSLHTHRESESLTAVNCSGGSGPSSSEIYKTMFSFFFPNFYTHSVILCISLKLDLTPIVAFSAYNCWFNELLDLFLVLSKCCKLSRTALIGAPCVNNC